MSIWSIFLIIGLSLLSCSPNNNIPNNEEEIKEEITDKKENKKVDIRIKEGLFDYDKVDDLGLSYPDNLQHIMIFKPTKEEDMKFNNHPQLVIFKNRLYATWVGHPLHEPSPESFVYYSYSDDGVNWHSPIQIGPENRASGGWITDGEILGCLIIAGDKANKTSITEVLISTDGKNWSAPKTLIQNAGISESARKLPNGRFIMVCHGLGTGVFSTVRKTRIMYTDAPDGLSGWKEAYLPNILPYNENEKEKVARPVEASWYRQKDGTLVMLFRDLWFEAKDRTWKLLVSVSYDNGATWTAPVLTNIPDSDSMQCAGNLDETNTFFVNNPVPTRRRVPLTVGVSTDGEYFDKVFLLRGKPQPKRFEGISKTEGYSYPGAVVWKDYLYVAYATNKEDVEISRVPVKSLR
jgi:hypothetical protein